MIFSLWHKYLVELLMLSLHRILLHLNSHSLEPQMSTHKGEVLYSLSDFHKPKSGSVSCQDSCSTHGVAHEIIVWLYSELGLVCKICSFHKLNGILSVACVVPYYSFLAMGKPETNVVKPNEIISLGCVFSCDCAIHADITPIAVEENNNAFWLFNSFSWSSVSGKSKIVLAATEVKEVLKIFGKVFLDKHF